MSATINGLPVPYLDLEFLTAAAGGGFFIDYYPNGPLPTIVDGPQIFAGDTAHPVFHAGTVEVIDPGTGEPEPLVISVVSLPATAPMFGAALFALGALGFSVGRKRVAAA